jgi:sugar phosphate isomerase/epimerase
MQLGLSSFTFGWAIGVANHPPAEPLNENGLLDKCGAHGLKLLQVGDNLPLHCFDPDRLRKFAQRAKSNGVQLEVGARGFTLERLETYVSIARQLDAKLIRFVVDDIDYHPAPDQIMGLLREGASLLDGLQLGLENHDRFPAARLRRMIESTGDQRIGVCLDTANSLGAGEGLETVLTELGPLTINLHIKDFRVDRVAHLMGFTVRGCPAGQGFLDVPGLLQKLQRFDKCHTAVLEQWTPPKTKLEETIADEASWASQSVAYLKPFFP